jgi:hypothetical protein
MQATILDETVQFWQPRSLRTLTHEDARQAIENVTGFFTTLQRWAAEAAGEKDKLAA